MFSKPTVGSLFSGIGGLDLGLERAGFEVKWQVENDAYCQGVLEKHWPGVARFGDIRQLDPSALERVDLICGGFPCQDISQAGKRAGIDGEKSGLWSEFYRIICSLRPRYVLVENVAALLIRGIDRVLGDLAASGYDAEWDCIPAAAVGAPHRRDRVFIVAYPSRSGREGSSGRSRRVFQRENGSAIGTGFQYQSGNDGAPESLAYSGREHGGAGWQRGSVGLGERDAEPTHGQDVGNSSTERFPQSERPAAFGIERNASTAITQSSWWAIEPDVGRVAHGIPSRVDRLKGLGNAVVPQVAEWIGRQIIKTL